MRRIPETEYTIEAVTSSGPGGQNVNKVATKVQLRWNIGNSRVFTYEEKEAIRSQLENRVNLEDELMIDVSEERSQLQNRETAIEKLHTLVGQALKPVKTRRSTRPTRASREKRLDFKKRVGEKKRFRKMVDEE